MGVLVSREGRGEEAKPAIGERVEGEGPVVLGGVVMDAVEEEARLTLGLGHGGGEGRDRGR